MPNESKANKEIVRRLLEDENFIDKLQQFRKDNDIPPKGFYHPASFEVWETFEKNTQSLEKFIDDSIENFGLHNYSQLFRLLLMYYIPLRDYQYDHLLSQITRECKVFDGSVISEDLDEKTIKKFEDGAIILVNPKATKEDLKNLINSKFAWGQIASFRMRKGQKPSGQAIRKKVRDKDHQGLYQMQKDGFLTTDGAVKNEDNLPDKYKELIKKYPNRDTRKWILREMKLLDS